MPLRDEFSKTDIYGLFKPAHGSSNWGHLFAVNVEMMDRIMAIQRDRMETLEKAMDRCERRIADLEAASAPEAPEGSRQSDDE